MAQDFTFVLVIHVVSSSTTHLMWRHETSSRITVQKLHKRYKFNVAEHFAIRNGTIAVSS